MKRYLPAALAALVFCALLAPSAHAQIGIYGQFNGTHDGAVSAWYKGFTLGAYDHFLNAGPVHVGLDVRGSFQSGSQYHYRSFLVGPRLQVRPPVLPVNPYLQAEIGFGGSRYTGASPFATHYSNKLQYGFIGGLEYTALPRIDIRLPEITYLRMSPVASSPNASKVNVVSIGVGIVVRLP
jgi:hypothetical protein